MATLGRVRFPKGRSPSRRRRGLTPQQSSFGRGAEEGKRIALAGKRLPRLGRRAKTPFGVGVLIGFRSATK